MIASASATMPGIQQRCASSQNGPKMKPPQEKDSASSTGLAAGLV
jgi:hypothetical protein